MDLDVKIPLISMLLRILQLAINFLLHLTSNILSPCIRACNPDLVLKGLISFIKDYIQTMKTKVHFFNL